MKREDKNTVTGQKTKANPLASELHVLPGTASDPIPKLKYWLFAPLRWWGGSIARIAVAEMSRLPRRMREYSREPYLRCGYPLPTLDLSDCVADASGAESTFQHSCIDDIRSLRKENCWAGFLDMRMAAEAYRMGATWAIRTLHNASQNGSA